MSGPGDDWYKDGLCFECTRCGDCCSGFPGTVTVDDAEIAALATRLELDDAEFRRRYTRHMQDGSTSLREEPNYDCVFFAGENGCLVYEDRPRQCRDWPFWRKNVLAPESWNAAARSCPGMNQGRLYTLEEIEERAETTP